MPFNSKDAGLNIIPKGDDLIYEEAPDEGANQLADIMVTIFHTMKWLFGFLVLFWVIYAGVYIVASSSSEDSVKSGKNMIFYSISGLFVMLLIEPFVLDIFYGGGNAGVSYKNSGIGDLESSTRNFRMQIDGVIAFVKTLLVFISMVYVIVSGVRMITAFGNDDELGNAKKMFLPIMLGILVVIFNEIFVDLILYNVVFDGQKVSFDPNESEVEEFIKQVVGVIQYILQFVGLILFIFFIYGGFMYIVSFGNSDSADKGKKIFINSVIGMVILIFSYVLMWSLVNFTLD
jgi:hypothetical protein